MIESNLTVKLILLHAISKGVSVGIYFHFIYHLVGLPNANVRQAPDDRLRAVVSQ